MSWVSRAVVFACAVMMAIAPHYAIAGDLQPPVADQADFGLALEIASIISDHPGTYGVAVKHLGSGRRASVNGEEVFEAASLYKLAVMIEYYRQREAGVNGVENDFIVADVMGYGAAGDAIYGPVYPYPARDALIDMITLSDNDAAQLLLHRLDPNRINESMRNLGLAHTTVDYDTTTTADDILRLLDLVVSNRIFDPLVCQDIIDILLNQRINDYLPAYVPPNTPVAHKTGNLPGITHDAGIVFSPYGPFIIVLMSSDLDEDPAPVFAAVTRVVLAHFSVPSRQVP